MDNITARLLREFAATPASERGAYLEAHRSDLTRARLRALSVETMVQVQAGQFGMATSGGQFLELAGEVAREPLLRFDGAFVPAYIALARYDGRTARQLLEALGNAILSYGMDADDLTLCQQILAVKRGAAAVQIGDIDALRAALKETVPLLQRAPNPIIDLEVGNLAGVLLRYLGQFDDATYALNEVAKAADALPNPILATQARINRAGVEVASGRVKEAEHTLLEALKTAPKSFVIELELQRGIVLGLLERTAESRAAVRRAQRLARELGNTNGETRSLLAECALAHEIGDRATVKALLSRLKPLIEQQQQPLLTFAYTAASGRLALLEKDPAHAEAVVRRALPQARGKIYLPARLDLLLVLSEALVCQSKWDAADIALNEVEDWLDYQRSSLTDPTTRNQFREAYADVYTWHVLVAIKRNQLLQTFLLAERQRSVTLNDLIRSTDWRIQTQSLNEADAARMASLERERAAAYAALSDAVTTDERESARARVEQVATARKTFEHDLTRAKPLLSLRGWEGIPTQDEVAKTLFAGSKPICYLSFHTCNLGTMVFGLLGKNGSTRLTAKVLPALISPALDTAVKKFHRACSTPDDPNWEAAGRPLFAALLEPLRSWWQGAERVYLVPDGALSYLPWAALRDPKTKKFFGEDLRLVVAPSLTTLYYLHSRPPSRVNQFVGYGACHFPKGMPPLAQSGPEVKAISAILGKQSVVRLANEATAPRLRADVASARILHLATHGRAEESRPLESAVFLTPTPESDGIVTTRDLLTLPLDTDLVTLSACESALGTRFQGEGIVGPAWGLLAAGSRSVLASHWSVDDNATRLLMTAFYKELAKGRPCADALRLAQKNLRANPQYTHPCYWAAFSLHGAG